MLGDAHDNIKKMMFQLFENPKILAVVAKNESDISKLKTLDASLCNHFYHSPTEDPKLETNLLRFITELVKVNLHFLFHSISFAPVFNRWNSIRQRNQGIFSLQRTFRNVF